MFDICTEISSVAPHLFEDVKKWTAGGAGQADLAGVGPILTADPVWGNVPLLAHEQWLLTTPFLGRLGGVRQLGLALAMYPNATHSRLEHSIGVLFVATLMLGEHAQVSEQDMLSVRLAALLHDIGHGPVSHASERLLFAEHRAEAVNLEASLRKLFSLDSEIPGAELAAAIIIACLWACLWPKLAEFLPPGVNGEDICMRTVARVLGSESFCDDRSLARMVSGKADADKFDYVVRDGLSIGFSGASHLRDAVLQKRWTAANDLMSAGRQELYTSVYRHPAVMLEERAFALRLAGERRTLVNLLCLPPDARLLATHRG